MRDSKQLRLSTWRLWQSPLKHRRTIKKYCSLAYVLICFNNLSLQFHTLFLIISRKALYNYLQDASTLVAYRNLFCLAFVGPVTTGDKTAIEEKIVSGWQSSGSQYASMEVNIRLQEMYLEIATRYLLF